MMLRIILCAATIMNIEAKFTIARVHYFTNDSAPTLHSPTHSWFIVANAQQLLRAAASSMAVKRMGSGTISPLQGRTALTRWSQLITWRQTRALHSLTVPRISTFATRSPPLARSTATSQALSMPHRQQRPSLHSSRPRASVVCSSDPSWLWLVGGLAWRACIWGATSSGHRTSAAPDPPPGEAGLGDMFLEATARRMCTSVLCREQGDRACWDVHTGKGARAREERVCEVAQRASPSRQDGLVSID